MSRSDSQEEYEKYCYQGLQHQGYHCRTYHQFRQETFSIYNQDIISHGEDRCSSTVARRKKRKLERLDHRQLVFGFDKSTLMPSYPYQKASWRENERKAEMRFPCFHVSCYGQPCAKDTMIPCIHPKISFGEAPSELKVCNK